MNFEEEINRIRHKIIDVTLIASAVFVTIALVGSLTRMFYTGWLPLYGLHSIATALLLMTNAFKSRLSLKVKAFSFFLSFFLVAVSGGFYFKLAGGFHFGIIIIVLSTLLFGRKEGILYSILILVSLFIVALLSSLHILKDSVDYNSYMRQPTTWLSFIVGYSFIFMVIIYSLSLYYKLFNDTLRASSGKTEKLLQAFDILQKSEDKYRSVVETSRSGYVFVDNSFNITFVNKSFSEMTGYQPEDLLGKSYKVLIRNKEVDWDSFLQSIATTYNERKESVELEMSTKDGNLLPISVNIYKSNHNDSAMFWAVLTDLREKKSLEKEVFSTMLRAEENERGRYAKELHDGLGPLLSTSMIYVHSIGAENDIKLIKDYAARAYIILEDATTTVKDISNNLSPLILKEYGVAHAIRSFIEKITVATNIKFIIEDTVKGRLEDTIEFTCYRVMVELCNNSIKYSQANMVKVSMRYETGYYRLQYSDNGVGFEFQNAVAQMKGFGILNLEHRIKKLGGTFIYETSEGKGVNVSIAIKTELL